MAMRKGVVLNNVLHRKLPRGLGKMLSRSLGSEDRRRGEFGNGGPAAAAGARAPAIVRLGLINKRLGELLLCTRKSPGARGSEGVNGRKVCTGRRQWRTAGLGWRYARAKERLGTGFYRCWRSVRRSWGPPRCRCTRGVGSKVRRRAEEWRPNGEWRFARRWVGSNHLAPSKRSQTSRTVALRHGAWTDGSSGASVCARGARTVGWRGAHVTSRESALWRRRVKTVR
jgi:hypothetical protein